MEIVTPAKVVIVEYKCDMCGDGLMRSTGIAMLSHPPKYPHKCNACGDLQTLNSHYPTTRIEPA